MFPTKCELRNLLVISHELVSCNSSSHQNAHLLRRLWRGIHH